MIQKHCRNTRRRQTEADTQFSLLLLPLLCLSAGNFFFSILEREHDRSKEARTLPRDMIRPNAGKPPSLSSFALETLGLLAYLQNSQNHRITKCYKLEGTSVGHLVQPPSRGRVIYSRLHRTASNQVLNISGEGDSTASLDSLFQCSITLKVKKFFLRLRWNILCFGLCPLPLVLLLGITEKTLAPSS